MREEGTNTEFIHHHHPSPSVLYPEMSMAWFTICFHLARSCDSLVRLCLTTRVVIACGYWTSFNDVIWKLSPRSASSRFSFVHHPLFPAGYSSLVCCPYCICAWRNPFVCVHFFHTNVCMVFFLALILSRMVVSFIFPCHLKFKILL